MTNNLEDYTYKKMPNYLYEQIKEKVFTVFNEYKINTLPIDCKKLAQSMGYKLVKYSDLSADSLITQQSNEGCSSIYAINGQVIKKIYYNDSQVVGRQRYTIMHEIAHGVYDHKEESDLADDIANFFARYSLVPIPLIHKLKIDNVDDIVETFNVSHALAENCLKDYYNWLEYGQPTLLPYESKLLELFGF